jgi:lipoprotein-anchoring transpeptidase ErfK/SrfK
MNEASGATNRWKATWVLSAVITAVLMTTTTTASAALESAVSSSSIPSSSIVSASISGSSNSKTPAFIKATARLILVSIPDRKMALFADGKVVRIYSVAVGKTSTPTPVGEFKIVTRVRNPTYYHKGQVVAAGKSNPVGTRWMGLSAKGYGIHGTIQPDSIGKAESTGCIRMGQRDLEEFFTLVDVGDTVQIRAERDDQIVAVFDPGPGNGAGAATETIARAGMGSSGGGE